ncbi:MAG: EamA family transporter [Acidimicrobiia bacterium]|nr:EamA family transporter [Acidimicrobiia bacterium]
MLAATALALAAALLHAAWNLLIKTADDRDLAAWGQFVFGAAALAPVLAFTGLPALRALPFLGVSAIVHVFYVRALVAAYRHGDFSLAYPLARGGGALVAALLGLVALGDGLSAGGWIALVVVSAGLASLVRRGAPRAEIGFALLTALLIGTYTVIDASGARHTDNGFAYGVALTAMSGVALSVMYLRQGRGPAFVASVRSGWPRHLVSGICLATAYSLVLVAMRFASVAYVATLRESSVVLGAGLGWLVLHERLGRRRLVSAVVVTAGLVGLIVAQV